MLNKIKINDFKSHHKTDVELNNLTLLVGTNSGGKSSVIQALLLIIHNISNMNASPLNGHLISVGGFKEACNYILNANEFCLGVCQDDQEINMKFVSKDDSDEEAQYSYISNSGVLKKYLNYNNNNIHYLSANRIGGQDLYTKNFDKYDLFGLNGEYAIDYLEQHKKDTIDEELIKFPNSLTLDAQVNFWLEQLFGQRLLTSTIPGTDKIKAEYKLQTGKTIRPKNTGSGISYLISIIIVCLASKRGDLIIIENPEIHLHPKAQSALLDFFIFIANSGRQLIIETHSDHLFNGIKVGINKNKITTAKIAVHFFTLGSNYITDHVKIEINSEGQILNAVIDLFDQFTNDLKTLVGF